MELVFRTSTTSKDDDHKIMALLAGYKYCVGVDPPADSIEFHAFVEKATGEEVCATRLSKRISELDLGDGDQVQGLVFRTSKTSNDDDHKIMTLLAGYKYCEGVVPPADSIEFHAFVKKATGEEVRATTLSKRILELDLNHRKKYLAKLEWEMNYWTKELARLENQMKDQHKAMLLATFWGLDTDWETEQPQKGLMFKTSATSRDDDIKIVELLIEFENCNGIVPFAGSTEFHAFAQNATGEEVSALRLRKRISEMETKVRKHELFLIELQINNRRKELARLEKQRKEQLLAIARLEYQRTEYGI